MIKILFVCLGNICRSPLAEGLAKKIIKDRGLEDKITIDSCGTSQYHIGEQPDTRTIENARSHGLHLNHEARQFSKRDLREFDYIIAMDEANLKNIKRFDIGDTYKDKIYLMREFDETKSGAAVPDPFFGGEQGFENVFNILKTSVTNLIDHVLNNQTTGAN